MCDDFIDDSGDDLWDGLEWQDFMIIGPMSEQIRDEKREKERIEKDVFGDDYLDPIEEK